MTEQSKIGELVVETEDERGVIGRAVDAIKSVVGGTPKLMLDTRNNTVEVDPAKLTGPERHLYRSLQSQGLRLMERLWRKATERRANALNALRIADQRLASLKSLAEQDGLGAEWALLGTPQPTLPAPELIRVRVLRPFTRQYVRPISEELRAWHLVHEQRNADEIYQPIPYDGLGIGSVTDVPVELFDELKAAGLVERAKPGSAKQFPNGQIIE